MAVNAWNKQFQQCRKVIGKRPPIFKERKRRIISNRITLSPGGWALTKQDFSYRIAQNWGMQKRERRESQRTTESQHTRLDNPGSQTSERTTERKRGTEGGKRRESTAGTLDLESTIFPLVSARKCRLKIRLRNQPASGWGQACIVCQETMVSDISKRQSFCREEMILKQPVCRQPYFRDTCPKQRHAPCFIYFQALFSVAIQKHRMTPIPCVQCEVSNQRLQ